MFAKAALPKNLNWEKCDIWITEDCHDHVTCWASLRRCLPKQPCRYNPVFELEFVDVQNNWAVYVPLFSANERKDYLIPPCPYKISYNEPHINIEFSGDEDKGGWILVAVLPKLIKWMTEMNISEPVTQSLKLVSLDRYNGLYQELKGKYVKRISEIWPECTDPQKFIHEDVAIAAYLMSLWEEERQKLALPDTFRQSFLDIGCGNGLLVYLLCSEGYPGKGIDIRSRKLWKMYPPEVDLEVATLTPSIKSSFPKYDWLLGNHSDELTPWLPVIAWRSTIEKQVNQLPTRFWLLPCCPFSFYGKFQREKFKNSNSSRYLEYLNFIEFIGKSCGYDMRKDRMRIPSTRRVCFVGSAFGKSQEHINPTEADISKLITDYSSDQQSSFQPRPSVEPVRNCTRIERTLQDRIIELTARCLLDNETLKEPGWNKGLVLTVPDLVQKLLQELGDLKQLKKECGGIQTLLKNHSHIFVVENQTVRFRSPAELSVAEWRALRKPNKKKARVSTTEKTVKIKPCWFFFNHPDGCPLNSESCRYLHD
nr:EOG090X07W1 [Cyclestheria hislopi]